MAAEVDTERGSPPSLNQNQNLNLNSNPPHKKKKREMGAVGGKSKTSRLHSSSVTAWLLAALREKCSRFHLFINILGRKFEEKDGISLYLILS